MMLFLLIINICIICFVKFLLPGVGYYADSTLLILTLVINGVAIIFLCNKNIVKNKTVKVVIMILYFLLMFALPAYKFEDHEHIFTDNHEQINEYVDYYNCYGIKIYRNYK